ncbi:MAG TPA: SDR family oxidoreductase, partial [Caulobacteraceae bacterium]|nr:SDR family oxidoreductase [Caulobacteraceae bacterium]
AVHHRDSADDAEATAAAIRDKGVRAEVVAAELSDDPQRLIEQASAALGPVTLLVNNASVFLDDTLQTLTREHWDAHMEANLHAPIALTQAFAAQGVEGLVVNIVDQRVWRPNPQFFSYSLSKAGLWWATRTMAQALAPRIRVNAIGPGPTLPSIHQSAEDFEAEAANILLERRVTPNEIAAALRYLIDAPLVTGQMIAVDGGQHLGWKTPDIT